MAARQPVFGCQPLRAHRCPKEHLPRKKTSSLSALILSSTPEERGVETDEVGEKRTEHTAPSPSGHDRLSTVGM